MHPHLFRASTLALLAFIAPAFADDTVWLNSTNADNDWSNPANWSSAAEPTLSDNAFFALPGDYAVNLPRDAAADTLIFSKGDIELSLNDHTLLTLGGVKVGTVPGSDASLRLDVPGLLQTISSMNIGAGGGTGDVSVSGPGVILSTDNSPLVIGQGRGPDGPSHGSLTISNGAYVYIGYSNQAQLGWQGGVGVITIGGNNATLELANRLESGYGSDAFADSSATINVNAGGILKSTNFIDSFDTPGERNSVVINLNGGSIQAAEVQDLNWVSGNVTIIPRDIFMTNFYSRPFGADFTLRPGQVLTSTLPMLVDSNDKFTLNGGKFDVAGIILQPGSEFHIATGSHRFTSLASRASSASLFLTPAAESFSADTPSVTLPTQVDPRFTSNYGSTADGDLHTRADLGTYFNHTGVDDSITMRWRTRTPEESAFLVSDILDLSGMANDPAVSTQTDPFMLQLSFDPAGLTDQQKDGLTLLYFNGADWLPASLGNFDAPQGIGGYNFFDHTISALLDHNSQFAIGIPTPEPATLCLLTLSALPLLLRRRRPLRDEKRRAR